VTGLPRTVYFKIDLKLFFKKPPANKLQNTEQG